MLHGAALTCKTLYCALVRTLYTLDAELLPSSHSASSANQCSTISRFDWTQMGRRDNTFLLRSTLVPGVMIYD